MHQEELNRVLTALAWDVTIPGEFDFLYHYTDKYAASSIFGENAITFRLTKAENFADKMEGKSIAIYYDLALEQLYNSGIINAKLRDYLEKFSPSPKMVLSKRYPNGTTVTSDYLVTPYIICFSTIDNDDYMYTNYITGNLAGYCFEFSGRNICALRSLCPKNGVVIKTLPILYGESVVEFIKSEIINIISDENKMSNLPFFIGTVLQELEYSSKLSKFRKENEVRLIVYVPTHSFIDTDEMKLVTMNEKDYLYLIIPKKILTGISFANWNNAEDNRQIQKMLNEREYDYTLHGN